MRRDDIDPAAIDPITAREGFFRSPADPSVDVEPIEDRLRDLEARYRGLIDRLPAVLYLDGTNEGDTMIDVSPGITELFGVSREEWLNTYLIWQRFIHPEDRDRVLAESDRCVETGDPFRLEYRAVRTDGREIWIHEDCVLVHGDDGRQLYWLGMMFDITDQVLTQRRLREAQEKYGALVEQIPAIVYVDLADEHMTSSYVSPQIEPLLGVTPEEYVARSRPLDEDVASRRQASRPQRIPQRPGLGGAVRLRIPIDRA